MATYITIELGWNGAIAFLASYSVCDSRLPWCHPSLFPWNALVVKRSQPEKVWGGESGTYWDFSEDIQKYSEHSQIDSDPLSAKSLL